MTNKIIGEASSFVAPFAIILVVLLAIFILMIIWGGNRLKKILTANRLKVVLNDYWISSDNNGTLLKSEDGNSIKIFPGKKGPIDFNEEKKGKIKLLALTNKKQVIDTKYLEKSINGFSWDILLYKTAPLSVIVTGFLSLETKGIYAETEVKLNDENEPMAEHIDFNTIFRFLQKTT